LGARSWRFGLALLICSLPVGLANADEETASPAQVAEWIVQLDADLFSVRKSAQQELENAGLQALEAVAKEALSGSLESSTRALNVMLAWTESTDYELQIAALEKLGTLPNRPIVSSLAAKLLADAHEQAALKAFLELGGRYEGDRLTRVINRTVAIQVIVDSDWKGGLEGLEHLAAMHRATAVSFYFAPVDEGVLDYLVRMPNLRRIEFFGTKVSKETLEELAKRLPNLTIDVRRSGALLGIAGNGTRQGPVVIDVVSPNSAAAKADLRVRDAILELEDEKIKDFRDLTQRISQFQPGDTVELVISRDGNLMKKKVTFDRWGKKGAHNANKATRKALPVPRRITLERR